ncbi:cilia and flagella-associated protein 47-like isoform X2 [Onthophagus taurus]
MEVIHPNATETFTCLIFPPTYYGIQCSINLFIRNYSATGYMFGTFGDILDKYIEIDKARIERMDFKFFDMTPSDGVFQSNETRVFKFTFSPFQIDKNTKNIPYFFCKYVMFRFLCDHYFGPTADVEGTFQSSYSNVAFCRNVASSRCNTFRRDSVSIYIFSKEKSHHFSVTQTDDNYTRFYLYGTAEPPSVKIIPDSLIIENITINMRETRVIELKNNSKNLPIIFRYKKIPFIFLESEYFHVKSLGSIQISVHIAPKRLGRINTHLEFDLMYYNNNELKVIGETKINIEYNVSIISKKLKKYSISSLKPITLRDKIKSVTLSNLFHIEKNNDYYNTFIRRKQFIKSKSMVSFSGNEEYDVTDMRKVVCKDLKLSKCGKLVLNEKIKRNMFFFPLTPQEMANVVVLPPVIKTPRIACDNNHDFKVLVQNFNSIPVRLIVSTDKERSIIFLDGNRYIINKNTEQVINISYKSDFIGYYVSILYFIINESTVITVPLLAEVVPSTLQVLTNELQLDLKNNSKYIEIENCLNIDIPFMWLLNAPNVMIKPCKGTVPSNRKLVCMVSYCFDQCGPDSVVAKLYSKSITTETVEIELIRRKSKLTAEKLSFGKISLNEEAMEILMLKNNSKVNRLKFYIKQDDIPKGLSVFPLTGFIHPLTEFSVYIVAKFTHCVVFNLILKIYNTSTDEVLEIPIEGEVIYPDVTITPKIINIDKIPSSTIKYFNIILTNNSPVPAYINFALNEYEEFFVSKSIFPFTKDIVTSLKIDGESSEKIYIHFTPHEASSCQFYLPIVINNLLGPPILNDYISTKVQYYLNETYSTNDKYGWMPDSLPCTKIHTLIRLPIIEISKTFIKFSTFPSKRNQSTTIFISNPNHIQSEKICIKFEQLHHPLYIEDYKTGDRKILIFTLKPNEKVSFTISFKPNPTEYGEYTTLLPIYLRSDTSTTFHNLLKIEAVYQKPDIQVALVKSKDVSLDLNENFVFSFYPLSISYKKRDFKYRVTCTNHLDDCKLEVKVTRCRWLMELQSIKWEILGLSKKTEHSGTYSVDLVVYEQDDMVQEYRRWFEIKCSCGGYWLQKQERLVENSVLTAYFEIEQKFTRSLRNCFSCYPLYPEPTHPSFNFMEQVIASAECWLNTQVIFCADTYQIKSTIASPNLQPPSSLELKRRTKLSGIPILHIIGNIMGPEIVQSLTKKKSNFSSITDTLKYLYRIYKTIINKINNEGGALMHLRPEHLFYYGGAKMYYEEIFNFKEYPLPLSSTMLHYKIFSRLRAQSWLDFTLQLYKCLYLKKVIQSHCIMSKCDNFKNTPLSDYFSQENVPIQPAIYSESESLIMNWLQFHYNENRNSIWENVTLNATSVDLYNNSLCDGLVFGVVLITYCPYLKVLLQDLFYTPKRYEEMYHNVSRIIQSLEMINYSFTTKPEEIVKGNSIRLLMFSVYLFDILPNMYPIESITLKTGLSTNITNKIELENNNPFPIAYKIIFINNDLECFSTTINFFEIKANNKVTLAITYFAKFAKEIKSTLILSGECSGYRYVTNKSISLIGTPDLAYPTTTIKIQQNHLDIKHYKYLIKSPYKIRANYRLQISYETLHTPDDLLPIRHHKNRDLYSYGRLVPKSKDFEFNENGEIKFAFMMTAFVYIDLDIWLYFCNETVGDFIVKVSSCIKDSLQREEIIVTIPKYVLHITERPRKVILEIPNRNHMLLTSIKTICVGLGGTEEGKFWARVIETPAGPNILSSLYLVTGKYSNLPQPISCDGVTYKVTRKTEEDTIMPDTIYFEEECTDLTTKVPIILQNSRPNNFSFVLESIPLFRKRYYTVCFQFE